MRAQLVITLIVASLVLRSGAADSVAPLRIVGTIQYGQTMQTPQPYGDRQGFRFYGKSGDRIGVLVKSADGDPILWVTDASFKVLAFNDDATNTTTDSHVALVLPANSNPNDKLYLIVVRDYNRQPATFRVTLSTDMRVPLQDLTRKAKRH